MKGTIRQKNPQVGPGSAGESHGAPGGASSPVVCGGGTNREEKGRMSRDEKRKARKAEDKKAWESDMRRMNFPEKDIREMLDMTDTSDLSSAASSRSSSMSGIPRKRKSVTELDSDDSEAPSTSAMPPPGTAPKRGRGRPPTTGEYVGLAKAKQAYKKACEEEEYASVEEDVERRTHKVKNTREQFRAKLNARGVDVNTLPKPELEAVVKDCIGLVTHVESQSKNLQGQMRNALKMAARYLREAFDAMSVRTEGEELSLLQTRNAALEREVADLRHRVESLTQAPAAPALPPVKDLVEEVTRGVLIAVGNMVDARLSGLEDRLPILPRLRPELAHDRRARSMTPVQEETPAPPPARAAPRTGTPVPSNSAPREQVEKKKTKEKGKRKKRQTLAAQEAASATANRTYADAAKRPPVVGKRKEVAAKGKANPSQQKKKKAKMKKRKPRVPKTPKSAAILLSLQAGASEKGTTYLELIEAAEEKISLQSLGIDGLRFRPAAGGARLLEIEENDCAAKADALVEKMRALLSPDVVRITRPYKRCSLRVRGLADSVKPEAVEAAIAAVGSCAPDLVKAGKVGAGGAVLVTVPATAAKKVVEAGRIKVGWILARVEVAAPRPVRCYRCMSPGHFAINCDAAVNLTGRCYRCGKAGHMVRDCTAASPHCAVCAAAGKPAAHAVGEEACVNRPEPRGPRPWSKRGRGKNAAPIPPPEAMETAAAASAP